MQEESDLCLSLSLSVYIYIYTYIRNYICICIYVYIYIERERERENERKNDMQKCAIPTWRVRSLELLCSHFDLRTSLSVLLFDGR